MKRTISFEIDEEIASKAEAVYFAHGMDTEMALGIFMRRTVLESRLPIDLGLVVSTPATAVAVPTAMPSYEDDFDSSGNGKSQRTNSSITQNMVEALWNVFRSYYSDGGDIRSISNAVANDTGMNPGSAFIYMTILNNLLAGNPNTRNMKMKDLEFYLGKIKDEFGDVKFNNALSSLEQSVPYWDKPDKFGLFASHVRAYIKRNRR